MAAGTVEWSKLCSSTSKIKRCPLTTWPHDDSDQCFTPKGKKVIFISISLYKKYF